MAEPTHAVEQSPRETRQEYTISGPSLLGIGQSPEASGTDSDLTYLYEDEAPRHTYWRLLFILLVLAGVGSFLAYQWKQNASWHSAIIGTVSNVVNRVRSGSSAPSPSTTSDQSASSVNGTKSPDAGSQSPASSNEASSAATPQNQSANPSGGATETPGSQAQNAQAQNASALPQSANTGSGTAQAAPKESDVAGKKDQEQSENALAAADTPTADAGDTPSSTESATPARTRRQAKPAPTPSVDNADAQMLTRANAFLYGNGVPRNCNRALSMIRSAADNGYGPARVKLGALYATGQCTSIDHIRAYYWLTLAKNSDPKNQWIERNRKMLWNEMSQEERSRITEAMP